MSLFMSSKEKQYLANIEAIYADKLGNCFMSDLKARRQLVRAVADFHEDRYEASLSKLKRLQDRGMVPKDRQVVLFFEGACSKGLGRLDQAVCYYEEVLRITPTYSPALSNLSVIYIDVGNYQQALPYAKKAVESNPDNPYAAHNLATIQFNLYHRDEAKKYAMKAISLLPQFKQSFSLLAMIYATEHNRPKEDYFSKMAIGLGQNEDTLNDSKRYYTDRYEIHEDAMRALSLWKRQTQKTAIHIEYTKKSDSVIGLDKNGWLSYAKIICSNIPDNDLLPKQGTIFISIQNEEAKVTYSSDENKETVTASEIVPICFKSKKEWMPFANCAYHENVKKLMEQDIHLLPSVFENDDFVFGLPQGERTGKLLGYPGFSQLDPREGNSLHRYDTLLMELHLKQSYFLFISNEDLRNLDFSDILLLMQ